MKKAAVVIPNILGNSLIALAGSFGMLYSLTSAYSLPFQLSHILLFCALFSLLFSGVYSAEKRGRTVRFITLGLFVLAALLFYRSIYLGAQGVVRIVWNLFQTAMPSSVASFPWKIDASEAQIATAMNRFGVFFAALSCYGICFALQRLESPMFAAVLVLPLFLFSFMLYYYPPNTTGVICGLLFYGLLLLSANIRKGDKLRANLALTLLIPALLAMLLITTQLSDKIEPIEFQQDSISAYAEKKIEELGDSLEQSFTGGDVTERENLNNVGPQVLTGKPVMRVRGTSPNRVIYLRGASYGVYDGHSWQSVSEPELELEVPSLLLASGAASSTNYQLNSLSVIYNQAKRYVLTPYYYGGGFDNSENAVYTIHENHISTDKSISGYSVSYFYIPQNLDSSRQRSDYSASERAYISFVYNNYLGVDEATAAEFIRIAQDNGINIHGTRRNIVDQVARFMQGNAYYELDTPRQPQDTDFALYFCEQSKQGYCVHFATAATVMLRSLGVPARYVTGYVVKPGLETEDGWTIVTEDEAHAWVEVYFDSIGWIPVEVTGGQSLPEATPTPSVVPSVAPTTAPSPDVTEPSGTDSSSISTPKPDSIDGDPGDKPVFAPDGEGDETGRKLSPWWLMTLSPFVLAGLVVLRRKLILRERQRRFKRSDNKRYIVMAWRYWQKLKSLGAECPARAYDLTQKAIFSRNGVSNEERSEFTAILNAQIADLKRKLKPARLFWARWLRALL